MSILLKKSKNISEVFDPVKDFYKMRYKNKTETRLFIFLPMLVCIVFLVVDALLSTRRVFSLDDFTDDFLNQIVTMLTLFISFSMAYLSIIITSSSANVDNLKKTLSGVYEFEDSKKGCSLYQVLVCEITYTLIIEICFLLLVMFEKFLIFLLSDILIKYIIAIDIGFFVHILIIMLVTVKDIYYSFWKSE